VVVLEWPVFSTVVGLGMGVFWLSFVWEVGGDGEVSLEVFLVLAVVWEELFQFSVEAFLVEVLEMDGLVDYDVLCELGWYGEDLLVVG
jgi:hypothetical protein